jgi:hypothetical protein
MAAAVTRHRLQLFCAALLACGVSAVTFAMPWTVSADDQAGLPSLSKGGAEALASRFTFWGTDWVWAAQQTEFKVIGPFEYSITGKNSALNLDLTGHVTQASARRMVWQFDLDAHSALSDVIGGGLSFAFDLANFGGLLGEPQLLAGNRGWSWGRPGSAQIEMRFDPPLAALYFEPGRKSELRAFFYKDRVPQGHRNYVATLTVSDEVSLSPTSLERFGVADYSNWPQGILDWNTSPVDLSFLNAPEIPAGKHGFLQARADRLVFEDGTPARFWGTNLAAYALFSTSKENIKSQARRLSQLGFNLVRLTHQDSEWVNPNIFGGRQVRDTESLSAAMLEQLDWWIKCLKDEGIYVWLDLEDGRRLKAADGVEGFEEIRQGKPSAGLKGYNYVNTTIKAAMQRFNEMYLGHQNRFTGLRYKDDPAIAAVLITNENDLTNHFANALLPDKGVPLHAARYMRLAEEFADQYSLPRDKVWRAWEAGPAKLFLNDLEQRFNVDMITRLHALGVRSPLVTTSTWGMNSLGSLPALTVGDIIDVHSYGGAGELERNPIYGASMVDWIAAAQVIAKPLSVTEWGLDAHGSLAPDRQNMPLYVAASAAMQGWGALMFFAYSQEAFAEKYSTPSIYHAYNDPALMATQPAAALLFRQGHVTQAKFTYVFAPSEQSLFYEVTSPGNSVALRTAAQRGRLLIAMPKVPQLPWLRESQIPAGAKVIRDPHQAQIPIDSTQVVSDSGELRRNWDEGTFAIDTPQTQAVMGWIGARKVTLSDVEVDVATKNSVVAVQSLDDAPLRKSQRIMISLAARSIPKAENLLPYYSEPVEGKVLISAPPGLSLRAWDAASGKLRRVAVSYAQGHYVVTLDRSLKSYWLLLDHGHSGAATGAVKDRH